MPANSLFLPACVRRTSQVHDVRNKRPLAVCVSVAVSAGTGDALNADDVHRRVDYVLMPEFKVPTAVAAKPGEDVMTANGWI